MTLLTTLRKNDAFDKLYGLSYLAWSLARPFSIHEEHDLEKEIIVDEKKKEMRDARLFLPSRNIFHQQGTLQAPLDNEVKFISGNVYECRRDMQLRNDLECLAAVCRANAIFLQEYNLNVKRPLWELPSFKGWSAYYVPEKFYDLQTEHPIERSSGMLTMIAAPFSATHAFELPTVTGNFLGDDHVLKRCASYVTANIVSPIISPHPTQSALGFVNTHFEIYTRPIGRAQQASTLVQQVVRMEPAVPLLMAADANALFGRPFSQLEPMFDVLAQNKIVPVTAENAPTPCLDYVFAKDVRSTIAQYNRVKSSDHPFIVGSAVIR